MKITTSRKTWIARIDDIEDVSGVDQFPLFSWFNLSTEAEMLGKMINWRNVEEVLR